MIPQGVFRLAKEKRKPIKGGFFLLSSFTIVHVTLTLWRQRKEKLCPFHVINASIKIFLVHIYGAARERCRLETLFAPLHQTPPCRIASLAISLFASRAFHSKVSLLESQTSCRYFMKVIMKGFHI